MKTTLFVLGTLCLNVLSSEHSQPPIEIMSDITNDFGVCVLQLLASPRANTVFSPYGLVSVSLLVYEGSTGVSAAEFHNTLHLPWHRDITRLGFRDLHRYLRSYFTSDGFLRGLILNKPDITLRPQYIKILQFYGFQPDAPFTKSPTTSTSTMAPVINATTITPTTNNTTVTPVTNATTTITQTTNTTTVTPVTNATTITTPTTNTTTMTTTVTTPSTTPSTTVTTSSTTPSTNMLTTVTTPSTTPSTTMLTTVTTPTTTPSTTVTTPSTTPTTVPLTTSTATPSTTVIPQSATSQSIISQTTLPASTTPASTTSLTETSQASTSPVTDTSQTSTSQSITTQTTPPATVTPQTATSPGTTLSSTTLSESMKTTETQMVFSTVGSTSSQETAMNNTTTLGTTESKEMRTENITSQMPTSTPMVTVIVTSITSQSTTENMLTSVQEATTGQSTPQSTTVTNQITQNVTTTITGTTVSVLSDDTVTPSNGVTVSDEDLFATSRQIVGFTTSDLQSTRYFSLPTMIGNFQPMNDGTITLTKSTEQLTSPFASTIGSTGPSTITTSNIDDVVIVSTPADLEMLPLREMSMFDAIILGLNRETIFEPFTTVSLNDLSSTVFETTEGNVLNKRSTEDNDLYGSLTNTQDINSVTEDKVNSESISQVVSTEIPMLNDQSVLEINNSTENVLITSENSSSSTITTEDNSSMFNNTVDISTPLDVTESETSYETLTPLDLNNSSEKFSSTDDLMVAETVTSEQEMLEQENNVTQSGALTSVNSSTADQNDTNITSTLLQDGTFSSNYENVSQSSEDSDTEESSLYTILDDSITFPNKPREKRSIYGYNRNTQFGNWITSSRRAPWYQAPSEQWFWTYSGDKRVPVLSYTAYLPFAYIPSIGALALQLPLDDVRYSLLILLPTQNRGLRQMLQTLQWCPLRYIVAHLKETPVYAVVPTFTIVKHINLTPVLQKLGIREVFDSSQANLSDMSEEPNLYVRSIEQVVTVSVRKYYNTNKWIDAVPSQIERHFLATHPFAFFVIDSESKVSLLAGTIVDPLYRSS